MRAKQADDALQEFQEDPSASSLAAASTECDDVSAASKSNKTRIAHAVFEDLEQHPAWLEGLGLSCASSALSPENVLTDSTARSFAARSDTLFAYDGSITENPTRTSVSKKSCIARDWGICSSDVLLGSCKQFTNNSYCVLHLWRFTKKQFPILVCIRSEGESVSCHAFLTDTVGMGETALYVVLDAVSGMSSRSRLKLDAFGDQYHARCRTSQQIVHTLL